MEWLKSHSDNNDNCCIIFIGHGGPGILGIWNYEKGTPELLYTYEFASWVDILEYNVLTVIIDACFSGTIIRPLSQENRIIISSASPSGVSTGLSEIVFTYHFFNKLEKNVSYGKAWEYADKQMARMNIPDVLFPDLEKSFLETLKIKLTHFWIGTFATVHVCTTVLPPVVVGS